MGMEKDDKPGTRRQHNDRVDNSSRDLKASIGPENKRVVEPAARAYCI